MKSPAQAKPATSEPGDPETEAPVIFTVIGRQRTGKTTLLNALAETVHRQGGTPEIWNTDLLNRSHSINQFHAETRSPSEADLTSQRKWLEHRIMEMVEHRRDVVLDIGGGWTAFHELINGTPLVAALEEEGIRLIVVYMMGTERADADYLEDLQTKKGFRPRRSVIVLNEGLIPAGASLQGAFSGLTRSAPVMRAIGNGAKVVTMPALEGMAELTDRSLSFEAFIGRAQVDGFPKTSMFDRLRADRWFNVRFPQFLEDIGLDHLPRMPNGLPVAREGVS